VFFGISEKWYLPGARAGSGRRPPCREAAGRGTLPSVYWRNYDTNIFMVRIQTAAVFFCFEIQLLKINYFEDSGSGSRRPLISDNGPDAPQHRGNRTRNVPGLTTGRKSRQLLIPKSPRAPLGERKAKDGWETWGILSVFGWFRGAEPGFLALRSCIASPALTPRNAGEIKPRGLVVSRTRSGVRSAGHGPLRSDQLDSPAVFSRFVCSSWK